MAGLMSRKTNCLIFHTFSHIYFWKSTYLCSSNISSTACFSEILKKMQDKPCSRQHHISYSWGWPRKKCEVELHNRLLVCKVHTNIYSKQVVTAERVHTKSHWNPNKYLQKLHGTQLLSKYLHNLPDTIH